MAEARATEGADPPPALSINQPWAGLIVSGLKDLENRDWATRFRGEVLIHAGLKIDIAAWDEVFDGIHPVTGEPFDQAAIAAAREAGAFRTGGIVGGARIVDCVTRSDSPWFVGRFGFVMDRRRIEPFRPCKGALGFFQPDFASRYAPKRAAATRSARPGAAGEVA